MGWILFKRAVRDLKAGWARYLALSILIVFSLFIVVSLMGASVTVIDGTDVNNKKLSRGDGEFSVFVPLRDDEIKKLNDKGVTLEKMFYADYEVSGNKVLRAFKVRENINRISVVSGALPSGDNEVVLERRFAEVNNIVPGDVIIFSSHPIPGNEKAVSKIMNELAKKGAKVIFQDTHVSGHACQEEIKLIYTLTKPRYAIPVHGEFRHLNRHKQLAMEMGIPKDNVIILHSGDVLSLSQDEAEVVERVTSGGIFVDGLGVGDVGNIVLRDRQNLSQNGLFIVVVTLDQYNNMLLAGPDIVSRGFIYMRESEDLIQEAKQVVTISLERCNDRNITDWNRIKNNIRDDLSEFIWKRMKRRPMILPIIMEV